MRTVKAGKPGGGRKPRNRWRASEGKRPRNRRTVGESRKLSDTRRANGRKKHKAREDRADSLGRAKAGNRLGTSEGWC